MPFCCLSCIHWWKVQAKRHLSPSNHQRCQSRQGFRCWTPAQRCQSWCGKLTPCSPALSWPSPRRTCSRRAHRPKGTWAGPILCTSMLLRTQTHNSMYFYVSHDLAPFYACLFVVFCCVWFMNRGLLPDMVQTFVFVFCVLLQNQDKQIRIHICRGELVAGNGPDKAGNKQIQRNPEATKKSEFPKTNTYK